MFTAVRKKLRAIKLKGSWNVNSTNVIYTKAFTNGVYYAAEDKRFAWWGKQTFVCTPKDSTEYDSVLEKFKEAYQIWQEFLDTKSVASFTQKWGQYTFNSYDNGDRKVGIRAMAFEGKYLSAHGDGTMRPTATSYNGASELFRLTPAPGNPPDAWLIRNSSGSYLNREYDSSTSKFTKRAIFSGGGSTLNLTGYIWYTMSCFGGVAIYSPSTYNYYVGITDQGLYVGSVNEGIMSPPPSGALGFIDVNVDPNPAGVAAANIATWNQTVIPTLLSFKINGKSPLVDPGEIGEIARKWEVDLENVDKTMIDQLKNEYCSANPTFDECKCLSARFVDPLYTTLKLSAPDGCWYQHCSGQIGDGKTLVTTKIVDERKSCPDVCQNLIKVVNSTNVSIKDVRLITTCTIPDSGGGGGGGGTTTETGLTTKQKEIIVVAVGGSVVVLSSLGLMLLLLSQRKK
jgi:hypothetical protein